MTKRQRMRRVAILCCNFMRNLAYYRTGNKFTIGWKSGAVSTDASFWRTVNGNFIDQCILDWCKLFGDKKGKHYWGSIVADKVQFEASMLRRLRTSAKSFEKYRLEMREYRDKFVAHLDSEPVMHIPRRALAKRSIEFYFEYLSKHEVQPGDLAGIVNTVTNFKRGYGQCRTEAASVYRA